MRNMAVTKMYRPNLECERIRRNSAFTLRRCRLSQTQNRRKSPQLLLKARRRHPKPQQQDALDPLRQKVQPFTILPAGGCLMQVTAYKNVRVSQFI